jgi:hypothetical protein
MRYLYTFLIIIISLPLTAQTVGQEYFPHSICTPSDAATGCNTYGIDGSGTINENNNGKFYGTSARSGAAYSSVTTANGAAYFGNRMYKLFKKGGPTSRTQFVAFEFQVPAGNYTYSIFTRWADQVDYTAGDAEKPFLKIIDNSDDSVIKQDEPAMTFGTESTNYVETTGTVTIPTATTVKLSVGKKGGHGNLGTTDNTNLTEIMFVDAISFKFQSTLSIAENKINDIQVFPNPAGKYIMFNGIDEQTNVDLFNISGKRVKSIIVDSSDSQIDVSNLSNGVYLARINNNKTTLFVKK